MIKREKFPLLLKRSHFINEIGFSNGLYYQLLHSGTLPTVTIGDRSYILRDQFFDMLENNTIQLMEEISYENNAI